MSQCAFCENWLSKLLTIFSCWLLLSFDYRQLCCLASVAVVVLSYTKRRQCDVNNGTRNGNAYVDNNVASYKVKPINIIALSSENRCETFFSIIPNSLIRLPIFSFHIVFQDDDGTIWPMWLNLFFPLSHFPSSTLFPMEGKLNRSLKNELTHRQIDRPWRVESVERNWCELKLKCSMQKFVWKISVRFFLSIRRSTKQIPLPNDVPSRSTKLTFVQLLKCFACRETDAYKYSYTLTLPSTEDVQSFSH